MHKIIEAVVDSDFKVGNYNILDDLHDMGSENNAESFSLSSIYGKGKILITKEKQGSRVECVNDYGEPAQGVAGCLRNYLTVQNYPVRYQDYTGTLYIDDMSPSQVLKFIEDVGMFSGFQKD